MAVTKQLARDTVPSIAIASVYTHIAGIKSLAHAPATTRVDMTDFDSVGRAENMVVQRGDTFTLTGDWVVDSSSGALDPGQEALWAAGQGQGPTAVRSFRLTHPGGATWTYNVTVQWTGPQGAVNALADFSAILEVTGLPVYAGVS